MKIIIFSTWLMIFSAPNFFLIIIFFDILIEYENKFPRLSSG